MRYFLLFLIALYLIEPAVAQYQGASNTNGASSGSETTYDSATLGLQAGGDVYHQLSVIQSRAFPAAIIRPEEEQRINKSLGVMRLVSLLNPCADEYANCFAKLNSAIQHYRNAETDRYNKQELEAGNRDNNEARDLLYAAARCMRETGGLLPIPPLVGGKPPIQGYRGYTPPTFQQPGMPIAGQVDAPVSYPPDPTNRKPLLPPQTDGPKTSYPPLPPERGGSFTTYPPLPPDRQNQPSKPAPGELILGGAGAPPPGGDGRSGDDPEYGTVHNWLKNTVTVVNPNGESENQNLNVPGRTLGGKSGSFKKKDKGNSQGNQNSPIRFVAGPNGTVDLGPTLERITTFQPGNPHRNDFTIFQNREGRLPNHGPGYYTEYVVPTPGARGAGPQRLVVGRDGEIYYTPDHYRTFVRVR